MQFKYSIGDQVIVRRDLSTNKIYYMDDGETQNSVTEEMEELRGQVVTIDMYTYDQYQIKELGFRWVDGMFEGLADETEASIDVSEFI